MSYYRSNRAVGQFKRALKNASPWQRLALSVLDVADRDCRALRSKSARILFQPGDKTPPAELERHKDELGKWILSYDFEWWILQAGAPRDDIEWYRLEMLRSLNAET